MSVLSLLITSFSFAFLYICSWHVNLFLCQSENRAWALSRVHNKQPLLLSFTFHIYFTCEFSVWTWLWINVVSNSPLVTKWFKTKNLIWKIQVKAFSEERKVCLTERVLFCVRRSHVAWMFSVWPNWSHSTTLWMEFVNWRQEQFKESCWVLSKKPVVK